MYQINKSTINYKAMQTVQVSQKYILHTYTYIIMIHRRKQQKQHNSAN